KDLHMALSALRNLFRGNPTKAHRAARPAPRQRCFRPQAEGLEDRVVPSVLFVDDDHAQRPNAQYSTISAAVAAAHPGDTIKVEAGTYHESVDVNKRLTIVADHSGG